MKKIIIIIAFLLPLNIFAQYTSADDFDSQNEKEENMSTLLGGNGKLSHGAYGGPQVKVGQFDDFTAVMLGGRGGWTINHSFTLGIAGFGMVNAPTVDYSLADTTFKDAAIRSGYGGFYMEYTNSPNSLLHLTGNLFIGWGGIGIDRDQDWFDGMNHLDDDHDFDSDDPWASFFIIEPAVGVEMNVTSFFRIGMEASYRFSNRIASGDGFREIREVRDYNFDGFSGNIVFKFGVF